MAQFDYLFYAFYTTSGVGTTGLTVTCDVRDSSGNLLVNNDAATGVGGGIYKYLYSSNNKDDFVAVFKTANSVDVKQIMSQATETIATKVWDSKLTNATFNIAQSAGYRLRQLAANVIYSALLPDQPATSTLVDDLTLADNIIFAVKRAGDPDDLSLIYMDKDGLTVVNQKPYFVPGDGSITVTGTSGNWEISLVLEQDATSLLFDYANQAFDAEIKAVFGNVSKTVWAGSCFITQGVIHTF